MNAARVGRTSSASPSPSRSALSTATPPRPANSRWSIWRAGAVSTMNRPGAVAAPTPSAPAASADATAYHRAGVAAYRAGDYPAAVAAFEEAYRLGRQPDSLFALAQAYRKVYVDDHDPGILLRTVELYRLYLAQAPDGRQAASVRELLSNLDPLAELVRARQPAAPAPSAVSAAAPTPTQRASDLRGVLSTRPWTEAELGTYSDARDARATWRGLAIGGFASAAVTAAVAGWLWIDDVPRPRP